MKYLWIISFVLFSTQLTAQDNNTLTYLDVEKFNLDFSDFDQSTALFMAYLSEVAYWDKREIQDLQNDMVVNDNSANHSFVFIDCKGKRDHTQAVLYANNSFAVIAFRGTEPGVIKDWITDGKFWTYQNLPSTNEELANMPPGHGGFRRSLMSLIQKCSLFEELDKLLEKNFGGLDVKTVPVYLTGHSLGAAISQLFVESLNYRGYNFSGAYHFAPPLAVSCSVNDYMKHKYGQIVYDIVNYKDYVPRAGRFGVAHFGKFLRICTDDYLYFEKEAYIKFRFLEYFKAGKYHSLTEYITALENKGNDLMSIRDRSTEVFNCIAPVSDVSPCR